MNGARNASCGTGVGRSLGTGRTRADSRLGRRCGVDLAGVAELAEQIHELPGIRLRGLMSIPAPRAEFAAQREAFARLARALESLQQRGISCDTLSMGMTQDMEAAIAEGSTLVRIGTAIFGERI